MRILVILGGFVREDKPQSMARLISLLCVLAGIVCAIMIIIMGRDMMQGSALVGVLIGSGSVTKIMSKQTESKITINKPNDVLGINE